MNPTKAKRIRRRLATERHKARANRKRGYRRG